MIIADKRGAGILGDFIITHTAQQQKHTYPYV
jgi:hypothetical protein